MNFIAPNMATLGGIILASARGTWVYDEGEKGHYEFFGRENFAWKNDEKTRRDLGISEDDLFDCIEQVEEELMSPENQEVRFGMMNKGGFKNVGAIYTSRTNPEIICVYTPTSLGSTPNGLHYEDWNGYFEWYFKAQPKEEVDDLAQFLNMFDTAVGTEVTKQTTVSPVMLPSYEEANEFFSVNQLQESDFFLSRLWNVNSSKFMGRGTREQMKAELLSEWKAIVEKSNQLDESKKKRSIQ